MQSNRTTPSRAAGVGTTLSLLLLGILLILAVLYFCLTQLRPSIEADLSERVTASLIEAGIDSASLTVEGQDVTLWGNLPDRATLERAEKIASEVYGIANVYNQATVDGESSSSQRTATEAALDPVGKPELVLEQDTATNNEASTTASDDSPEQGLSPSTLDINVVDGFATVQGIVPDEESITRINSALSGKFGRINVEDDMSTYVDSANPQWLEAAIFLIDQMDDIDNPSLKITQNKAVFGGVVSSETMSSQKTALAERLLGQYLTVSSDFEIESADSKLPAPVNSTRSVSKRPASLKIVGSEGDIRLTGTVSSAREASNIRGDMTNLFGNKYLDELVIDNTVASADWLSEVMIVAANVKSLDDFSVSVNSGQLLLSGAVSDRLSGQTLASTAAEITGDKLKIVNDFSPVETAPLVLSGEELLAQQLKNELDALNTSDIVFNKGDITLTDEAMRILDQVAITILNYPGQVVEIAGHTDSTGDALANLELSKERAIAVRDYLLGQNVPEGRLQPIGYGETKPVADNETREGQAANRRIEFNL